MDVLIKNKPNSRWRFWIDRGGTFTDLIGLTPNNTIQTVKLLSNSRQYDDAAIEGIRRLMRVSPGMPIPCENVESVKMGTTVATNALLERKGERCALLITKGLRDALQIGYQNRPRLFDLYVKMPSMLYSEALEADERLNALGQVLTPLDTASVTRDLKALFIKGYRSLAIVFMHAYLNPTHEKAAADIARQIGFTQVSTSSDTIPLIKLVGRGDTAVADAYLNPILQHYVGRLAENLGDIRLYFMQSNGGLTNSEAFQGKDSILSGPAGGIVGMAKTAAMAGIHKVIGFDMGGTSTDVSHFDGEYERTFETVVSGIRLRAPMMNIHTVAAGGGSIVKFDGMRFTVGPDSAGSDPGPICYRNGGHLTVTDCNVMLGKIQPDFFPHVFGPEHNQPIDTDAGKQAFSALGRQVGKSAEEVAEGFITIAVENMANAIRKISVRRGYDVTDYTLFCFGGAAGQHACRVADSLEMRQIVVHPLSGLLSAYGMGLADMVEIKGQSLEKELHEGLYNELEALFIRLEQDCRATLLGRGIEANEITCMRQVHLRYKGTNTELPVMFGTLEELTRSFSELHQARFGFILSDREIIVGTLSVEARGGSEHLDEPVQPVPTERLACIAITEREVYLQGGYRKTAFYERTQLHPGSHIDAPAIIIDSNATIVVEPGWFATVTDRNHLLLKKTETSLLQKTEDRSAPDPIRLEIFNNLFMSIAEQMGEVLAKTSCSVNIKERLDFSCAVFDRDAALIANAPHMPVHLGSMGESVRAVLHKWQDDMHPGDSFILNDPYGGGTHLPDITVVTPIFLNNKRTFFVASRGHHADIGGITPGSMASDSSVLEEEGVLIPNLKIVSRYELQTQEILACLNGAKYPARNPYQNIEDIKAQIASNENGVKELVKAVEQFGEETVLRYVRHVQDNAEESVRRIIADLPSSQFTLPMDNGAHIQVAITVDKQSRSATVDFTGTSAQTADNFNAPLAVCRAAVLYVFRTLVDEDIPMNEGCLRPITLRVPEASIINPVYPAAVVAGNVETSQAIVDCLYGAIGCLAEAQGTMNNLTFGNAAHQYYETICGGTGAGKTFDGTDSVHSHMTNSLMTDPEVLEQRYPVKLNHFSIRRGSGGQGKHRGGDGVIREIEFLEDMTVSILSGHRTHAPYGVNGGEPGKTGRNSIIRNNIQEALPACAKCPVKKGDRVLIETPGGGGYGRK